MSNGLRARPGMASFLTACICFQLGLLLIGLSACSGRRAPNEPETPTFRVVSSFPTDGATSVARAITFTITFSAAVDTSRFGFIAAPIPAGLDTSIVTSPDLKTFSATTTLQANTAYTVIFYTVQDTSGNTLEEPYILSFTTGSSFPAATVSGLASITGGVNPTPLGSLIGLVDRNPLDLLSEPDPVAALMQALRAITVVTDEAGSYTVRNVIPGTYWVAGTKDTNGNATLDPGITNGDDALGVYPNPITPASIDVAQGQALGGIDFLLFTP